LLHKNLTHLSSPASIGAGSANRGTRHHVTPVNTGVSKEIPAFAGMTEEGAGMTEEGAGMTDGGRNDNGGILVKFRIMQQSQIIFDNTFIDLSPAVKCQGKNETKIPHKISL